MDEAELINRLKSSEPAAFNALVDQYGKQVLNTCYRFMLNQEDAEDLAQEVFIETYQSISKFKQQARLSTWIYRIAVSKCLDELKKRNRKKRIGSTAKLLHLNDLADWITGGEMPDKKLKENEMFSQINNLLNQLPTNQRIAFTLNKMDGYATSDISEILGISVNATEQLISRARKKIGAQLKSILTSNIPSDRI